MPHDRSLSLGCVSRLTLTPAVLQCGAPIFNPHTFVLEDGGMKQTDEAQLAFKESCDPSGLLK